MRVICPVCENDDNMRWNSDVTFEDVGAEGQGIVTFWECDKCKTWLEIYITEGQSDE